MRTLPYYFSRFQTQDRRLLALILRANNAPVNGKISANHINGF